MLPTNRKKSWRLSISYICKDCTVTKPSWYLQDYDGMVYCPTVSTGYVVTRRNGKLICMSNTNPSQMMQAALGKVAYKTGKPIVVP